MSLSPPPRKRLRSQVTKLEDLPDDMLVEIFRRLPMNSRVENNLINKRWRRLMPYTSRKGILNILQFEFDAEQIGPEKTISLTAMTKALQCLLPQIGEKLKGIKFASSTHFWQMANVHLDLIIQHCPQLTELHLARVKPGSSKVGQIRLKELCLQLSRLTQLKSFGFQNFTTFTPSTVIQYAQFVENLSKTIVKWNLQSVSLSGFLLLPYVGGPNLTTVKLQDCQIHSNQLKQISQKATKLNSLLIGGCRTADVSSIRHMSNLTSLQIFTKSLSEEDLDPIGANCTKLNTLVLHAQLDDLRFLQSLTNLSVLSMKVTDELVTDWLPNNFTLPSIRTFVALQMDTLTDKAVIGISSIMPNVNKLVLISNRITDTSITPLLSNMRSLATLDITRSGITDMGLSQLVASKQLKGLVIHQCANVTNEGIAQIPRIRNQLKLTTRLKIHISRGPLYRSTLDEQLKADLAKMGVTLHFNPRDKDLSCLA